MARQARGEARTSAMAIAIIALAALIERQLVMANSDVAWLLTVAEKMLGGARLYVDVQETNPPASVWLYVPFAWLGQVLSMRPERLIDVAFLAAAAASAWSLGHWLSPQDETPPWALRSLGFAVLAVLPASCFGEREHAALILLLPLLGLARARAEQAPVSRTQQIGAALLIGVIACLKPHFIIALVAIFLAAAVLARSLRPLFSLETLLGAALFGLYGASTFLLYPAFWRDMMPISNALYLPARQPVAALLYGSFPAILAAMALVAIYFAVKRRSFATAPSTLIATAAMLGFLGVAIIQGKGWPYHFYPAFGLALLLTGKATLDDLQARHPSRLVPLAITALFSVQSWLLFDTGLDTRPVLERMRAVAPHPRMASLASDFALGFPAVRDLGGVWIGRSFSRWIPYHVAGLSMQPAFDRNEMPTFRALEEADRAGFIADLEAGRPTLILVERRPFDFLVWARTDGRLAAILACYEAADRVMLGNLDTPQSHGLDVELFRPRPGMTDPSRPLGCAPD